MANDARWQAVTLCALIAEARAIADTTDTLLAAHLSLAEARAQTLRDGAFAREGRLSDAAPDTIADPA